MGLRLRILAAAALSILLLSASAPTAHAAGQGPLAVPDMSSPRATLQSFLAITDKIFIQSASALQSYRGSGRLFPNADERRLVASIWINVPDAIRALDISQVSPVLHDSLAPERVLQLRSILDRIELPPMTDVPDRNALGDHPPKRWRLPNTEIDFVRIEDGPRAGDYVVAAETVARLPEFHERVESLPIKPGPALDVQTALLAFNPNDQYTPYAFFLGSPLGLSYIIPLRWIMNWPEWARAQIGDSTVWQWIGMALAAFVAALFLVGIHRAASRQQSREEERSGIGWHSIALPIGILVVAGLFTPFVCMLLRIGGLSRMMIAFGQAVVLYLTLAWLMVAGSILIGDLIVEAERLKFRSLDRQLIRLGSRLVGMLAAIGWLIQGADELGFPAYSVLAGLGVGGLAVALAARDSLANLLGSLLIMFEKPFRVGDYIRLSGTEGTVEDVGFRSTRIRTQDSSLISIPNNSVVNMTVENVSLRPVRRERFFLGLTYDTARKTIEATVAGIRQIILDHPLTDKKNLQVSFHAFNDSSLDILVLFHLNVTSYTAELTARQEILLQIMALAEELGVSFAFPSRTVYVENAPDTAAARTVRSAAL